MPFDTWCGTRIFLWFSLFTTTTETMRHCDGDSKYSIVIVLTSKGAHRVGSFLSVDMFVKN